MARKKNKSSIDYYTTIPAIVIGVTVGALTHYNILYTAIAFGVGVLLGAGIKKLLKK